jgi:DNA-binding transcriptional regulator YiaG
MMTNDDLNNPEEENNQTGSAKNNLQSIAEATRRLTIVQVDPVQEPNLVQGECALRLELGRFGMQDMEFRMPTALIHRFASNLLMEAFSGSDVNGDEPTGPALALKDRVEQIVSGELEPNKQDAALLSSLFRDGLGCVISGILESQRGTDPDQRAAEIIQQTLRYIEATLRSQSSPEPRRRQRRHPSPAVPPGDYIEVPSPAAWRALHSVVQDPSRFQDGNPWPCAIPDNLDGTIEARPPIVDLQPYLEPDDEARLRDIMWQQVGQLGDLDADVLDILSDFWIRHARHPDQKVTCTVTYLLERRGMKRKKGGAGRRGGYYGTQENAIREAVGRICILWIDADIDTYEIQPGRKHPRKQRTRLSSRAFTVDTTAGQIRLDGRTEVQAFTYSPGALFGRFLFGPGRQTALQSVKALLYHPQKERWEKRLARYLPWQWKCDAKNGAGVKTFHLRTLLDAIAEQPNRARPGLTRDRLEQALERLQKDEVIRGWQYGPEWNEDHARQPGWLETWLAATVAIEPPEDIPNQYRSIALAAAEHRQALAPNQPARPDLPTRMRSHRKALGMSCLQVGEVLGVSGRAIGQWESGARTPSPATRKRIMRWLDGGTDGTDAGA